jgi:hypothetical protein
MHSLAKAKAKRKTNQIILRKRNKAAKESHKEN